MQRQQLSHATLLLTTSSDGQNKQHNLSELLVAFHCALNALGQNDLLAAAEIAVNVYVLVVR